MFGTTDRASFGALLSLARKSMPEGKALCVCMAEDVKGTLYYIDNAGLSGFALQPLPQGTGFYLTCVFRHAKASRPLLADLLAFAETELDGAELVLDCFEPLAAIYGAYGFCEYDRAVFDPAFMPEGWNTETHGTPDVVFMTRSANPAQIAA